MFKRKTTTTTTTTTTTITITTTTTCRYYRSIQQRNIKNVLTLNDVLYNGKCFGKDYVAADALRAQLRLTSHS
ncbi:hypothetical protein M0802_007445 [Mischocyttarus mexicanus]|nr:hypothetical protein M0802_007445 [Mischocyttarus mexicanus]